MFSRLFLLMTLITAIVGGIFFWYYKDTQKEFAKLYNENATLKSAAMLCTDTVDELQANYEEARAELNLLNDEFSKIRAQNGVLAKKLEKNDIGVLGAAKPGLVGKIVNSATDKAGRCIEIVSGSPLTEKEKGATSARTFNSECPWLWPGGEE